MAQYTPPLRDMQFVLNEVLDLPTELRELPAHAELDSDTIAAIAGGIAEALYGLPDDLAALGWSYLPPDMKVVLVDFYSQVPF